MTGKKQAPTRHPALFFAMLVVLGARSAAAEPPTYKEVQPLLQKYCYDCHGEGASRGDVALDAYTTPEARRGAVKIWTAVQENLRADLMPPAGKPRPTMAERAKLIEWIQGDVQQVDCRAPDPGRVTLRRLNRVEYTNTIRDLFDLKIDPSEFFPPDDSGYGFDNIGDVLSVSPVLMEKYFDAAERVVKAVVAEKPSVPEQRRFRNDFKVVREPGEGRNVREAKLDVPKAGQYDVRFKVNVTSFDPFKGKIRVQVFLDKHRLMEQRYAAGNRSYPFRVHVPLEGGDHVWRLEVDQTGSTLGRNSAINVNIDDAIVRGPGTKLDFSEPHKRLFFAGPAPKEDAARSKYARELLQRVADRAFRRPVEESTVDRLAKIVRTGDKGRPGDFERGVRQALTAILTSPRFLFRPEVVRKGPAQVGEVAGQAVPIDDWALASRLSYLLWTTGPDADLKTLAEAGTLRKELRPTVERMLADEKADRFVSNFVGQWLHTRDVDSVPVSGRRGRLLNEGVRRAMRDETEMLFAYIMREDRDLIEMLTANYTFANSALAKFYGLPPIEGPKMQKVDLPPDSVRGGVLSHGSFLLTTSNPSRTSPVKRGLFVLENLLGSPPPPPPPDVPQLEDVNDGKKVLTVRQQMEIHRKNPACANCHARMDPIGLGLETFDLMGIAREKEGDAPIDPKGTLITGEKFTGVRDLRALLSKRKESFYRTVTRKLMTYSLGRGLNAPDDCAVEAIVAQLQSNGGKFSTLLHGIIGSGPFQMQSTKEDGL